MLLNHWNQLVSRHPERVALWHPEHPEGLSFGEIERISRQIDVGGDFVVAVGEAPTFFPSIIAAWRSGKPALLVETAGSEIRPILCPISTGAVLIKQTCGASGIARSLFFTASQVMAEAQRNISGLGLHEGRRGLAAISLAHSYGFGCLALPFLCGGIPLEIVSGPLPMFMHGALEKGGEVFLPGVPAIWKTWWQTGIAADTAITLALCAGSPLSIKLEQSIHADCGLKVHNFYGTSETGAIAFDSSPSPRTSPGFVGKALPGIAASVDAEGRINISSDSRAEGTDIPAWENEFSPEPYRTLDLGAVSDQGVTVHRCIGAAINVAGRKVSPARLREILEKQEGVVSAEVERGPSRDYERFEEIRVRVTTTPDCDKKSLREHFRQETDSWEMPRRWEFVAAD